MTCQGVQAAMSACETNLPAGAPPMAPRRQRAAKKFSAVPAEEVVAVATKKKTAKSHRRFQRLALGPTVEVADGHIARWRDEVEVYEGYTKIWVPVTEADQYEVVLDWFTRRPHYGRVRLLDPDGFPTTGQTGWTETDRWESEPAVVKFEKGQPLPSEIRTASARERRLYPDECVGGLRLIYPKLAKEQSEAIEWFPWRGADDKIAKKRRQFIKKLRRLPKKELAELNPPVEPKSASEQWFRLELTDLALKAGAWRNYPSDDIVGGWCCRLVEPQPRLEYSATMTEPWVYIQFPRHYYAVWRDEYSGELRESWPTESDGWKDGKDDRLGYQAMECGMWVPRSILRPISMAEAAELYKQIAAL